MALIIKRFISRAAVVVSLVLICSVIFHPESTTAGTIVSGGLWTGSVEPDFYIHFRATQKKITKLTFTVVAACLTKDTGETFNKTVVVRTSQTPALNLRNGQSRGQFEVKSTLEKANVAYNIRLSGSRGTARLTYWYDIDTESCNAGPVKITVRRLRN